MTVSGLTGSLIISAYVDGRIALPSWRTIVSIPRASLEGFVDVALPVYPLDAYYRLSIDRLAEDPKMPNWLTGRVGLQIDSAWRLLEKPFRLYALDSPYESAVLHWPIYPELAAELDRGKAPWSGPQSVLSISLRADFPADEAELAAAEGEAAA